MKYPTPTELFFIIISMMAAIGGLMIASVRDGEQIKNLEKRMGQLEATR